MRYFFLCIFVCFGWVVHAQREQVFIPFEDAYKRVFHIPGHSSVNIVVDGKLDEPVWQAPEGWTEDFIYVVPVERLVPPSHATTRAKLFMDDKYLYVGFYCKELPENMNRFIAERDERTIGDVVGIAMDTYHDFRAAIEFAVSLGGNKIDLVVTDDVDVNLSWNAVWEARTHVNLADSSWTAEFRIPFSQMRYNYRDTVGIWGLNLRRNIRHSNEMQKWSLIPRPNPGHVFSFGELHGMVDLPRPRGVEFMPYTLGQFRTEPRIEGSPYQTGRPRWSINGGLDAKIAMSDFTLDLTINPDFGQVELDPSEMNLTSLETFYEEKRQFFLEGSHLLDFNQGNDIMMFYTRRIGASPSRPRGIDDRTSFAENRDNIPILGAFKLTGTNRKRVSLGAIQSVTARTYANVTRNGNKSREVVEPLASFSAVRVRKNWKGNSLLGGMATLVNRQLNDDYLQNNMINNAFTAGMDFTHYFMNRRYYVDFKGMLSSLHGSKEAITLLQQRPARYYQRESAQDYLGVDPNRTSLSGTGGWLEFGHRGTHWFLTETVGWSSPGFDLNDIGFMRNTDYINNRTEISWRQRGIWRNFRSNSLSLTQANQWNFSGTPVENNVIFNWSTTTVKRFQFSFRETFVWNNVDTRLLRGGPDLRLAPSFVTRVSMNTDRGKRVSGQLSYNGWHFTDGYSRSHTLTPSFILRLGNHVRMIGEFAYTDNHNNLQYVARAVDEQNSPASQYIMGRIEQKTYGITFKMQVNPTPDISIQFYGSPFTSTGSFDGFKVASGNTKSRTYFERFHTLDANLADDRYSYSRDGVNYSFRNPNFSFNEFRSNLVARWEYRPGSTLFFVWEYTMSNRDPHHIPSWGDNLDRMFGLPASNIFMVKLNYWFGI